MTLPQSRRREATVDGFVLKFSWSEHRILERLLLRYPHTVPVIELIDMLWGEDPQGGPDFARTTLTIFIRRLRQRIGRDRIVSQIGWGYALNPGVGGPLVLSPPADQLPGEPPKPGSRPLLSGRRADL